MTLFRSEEHVRRWTQANERDIGEIVALEQVWRLARLWYPDPRRSDWRTRSRDESQSVLAAAGLVGPFWELPR